MTSQQQVRQTFSEAKIEHNREAKKWIVYVVIDGIKYYIGIGHSEYKAWTDTMINIGKKTTHYNKRLK